MTLIQEMYFRINKNANSNFFKGVDLLILRKHKYNNRAELWPSPRFILIGLIHCEQHNNTRCILVISKHKVVDVVIVLFYYYTSV